MSNYKTDAELQKLVDYYDRWAGTKSADAIKALVEDLREARAEIKRLRREDDASVQQIQALDDQLQGKLL